MPLDLAGLMALIAASRATRAPGMPQIDKSPSNVTATPMNRSALNDPHQIDPIQAMMAPSEMQAKQAQANMLQQQASVLKQFNMNDIFGNQGAATGATDATGGLGAPQMQAPFSGLPPAPPTQTNPFASAPAPVQAAPDASTMSAGGALNKLSFPDARAYAQQAGFQGGDADKMAAIAMAESSGNPYAHGDKNLGNSWGITQINEAAHGPVAKEAYGDPLRAMQLAYDVSQGGTNFRPWTMYKNGGYLKYMPAPGTDVAPQSPLGSNTSAGRGVAPPPAPGAQYTPAEVATYGSALSPQSAQQLIAAPLAPQSTPPSAMMPERGSNTAPPQGTPATARANATPLASTMAQAAAPSPMQAPPASAAGPPMMGLMAGIPPAPRGSGINPEALARGRMVLALGGIQGDPLSGAAQLLYNSPAYLRQKAEQEGYGKVGPDLYTAQGKKQIDINALPQELGIKQQFAYGDPQYNPELTQRLAQAKGQGENATLPQSLAIKQQYAYTDPANNPTLQANLAAAKTIGEKQGLLLSAGVDPASPRGQQMIQNTVPDTRPEPVKLADASNMPPGPQRDAAIQGAIPGNAPTPESKDYQNYVKDQTGRNLPVIPFHEWDIERRRTSAMMINTSEGMDAATAKARFEIDKPTAIETAKQAADAQRLVPQIKMVIDLADKTPGGWAGQISATAARAASALGIPVSERMSNAELFQATQMQFLPLVRQPGQQSNLEMEAYLNAVPGLTQSTQGRQKIGEMLLSMAQRKAELAQVYRDYVGRPELSDKLAELSQKPMFTPEQQKLLSSAGQAGSFSATSESEGRTATGPGGKKFIVKDGQWVPQ